MKMSEGEMISFVLAAFWRECLLSREEKINLHRWEVSKGHPAYFEVFPSAAVISWC